MSPTCEHCFLQINRHNQLKKYKTTPSTIINHNNNNNDNKMVSFHFAHHLPPTATARCPNFTFQRNHFTFPHPSNPSSNYRRSLRDRNRRLSRHTFPRWRSIDRALLSRGQTHTFRHSVFFFFLLPAYIRRKFFLR